MRRLGPVGGAAVIRDVAARTDRAAVHAAGGHEAQVAAHRAHRRFVDERHALAHLTLGDHDHSRLHESERLHVPIADALADRERALRVSQRAVEVAFLGGNE
jgi:hypothetical protein